MSGPLLLVLAVAIAYLAAHVAFDWLARRFLIISGAEYLLLGILLGPQIANVLSVDVMAGFSPLVTLSLGWVGAIVGAQFHLPSLVRVRALSYRVAFGEAGLTLLFVAAVELAAMQWWLGMGEWDAVAPAIALGAIAAVSAPAGIGIVARHLGRRSALLRQLEITTAIDALVGIATIGVLLAIRHPGDMAVSRPITPTEWVVISLAIGIVGGAMFELFLGGERDEDRLFISLAGAIILTSGAAAFLHLSPIFTAMVMSATLVNLSGNREEIARTLHSSERPFYFVLLIFAGASWEPSLRAWVVPVLLYLVARAAAKTGGARLAARLTHTLPALGPHWGRALLGQGPLALALGLEYVRMPNAPVPNVVFTAAIGAVLLLDISSAWMVHSVVEPMTADAEREPRTAGETS
jgi:Kef-type K+ transport system membrane component KefB